MTRRKAAVLKEAQRQQAKTEAVELDVRGSSTAESDHSNIDISVSRGSKTDPFDVQIDLKDLVT